MPLHCTYCHLPDHSRVDCPAKKKIRCWTCLAHGHVSKHCPRRPAPTPAPKKTKKSKKKPKSPPSPTVSGFGPSPNKRPPPSSSESDLEMTEAPRPPRPPLKQARPNLLVAKKNDPVPAGTPSPSTHQPPRSLSKLEMIFLNSTHEEFEKQLHGS